MKFFKRIVIFSMLGFSCHIFSMSPLTPPRKPTGLPSVKRHDDLHDLENRAATSVSQPSGPGSSVDSRAQQASITPTTNDSKATLKKQLKEAERGFDQIIQELELNHIRRQVYAEPQARTEGPNENFDQKLKKADAELKESQQRNKERVLFAWGAGATATTALFAFKLYGQYAQPNPMQMHRGILDDAAGAAGAVASGGISTAISEIGSKAMILATACAAAFGLNALRGLVRDPLKHAEKKDEMHADEIEARSAAHRKAMDKQSEVHRKAVEEQARTNKQAYEDLLEKFNSFRLTFGAQQELHIQTTNQQSAHLAEHEKRLQAHSATLKRGRRTAQRLIDENIKDAEIAKQHAKVINALKERFSRLKKQYKRDRTKVQQTQPDILGSYTESNLGSDDERGDAASSAEAAAPASRARSPREDADAVDDADATHQRPIGRVPVQEKVKPSGCCGLFRSN